MTSFSAFDYYSIFLKKSTKTMSDFSDVAFDKFVQVNDHNIKFTKNALDGTNSAVATMLEVKDPKEFIERTNLTNFLFSYLNRCAKFCRTSFCKGNRLL